MERVEDVCYDFMTLQRRIESDQLSVALLYILSGAYNYFK